MKGGNITYYFPTKNDLIRELTERLSESNGAIFSRQTEPGIYNFLDKHRLIYHSQYEYRALFVSLPLMLKQDDEFATRYAQRQLERKKTLYNELKALFMAGYFNTAKSVDMDTILHAITTINRFWISEATV